MGFRVKFVVKTHFDKDSEKKRKKDPKRTGPFSCGFRSHQRHRMHEVYAVESV